MGASHSAVPAAAKLELDRFMGDWFVIANIPLPPEKPAHNSRETYSFTPPNKVDVTFSFNNSAFDGPMKTFKSKAFVSDDPAIWGVQFLWPFKAEYVVSYIDDTYQHTIVARSRRDYVWVMARTQTIDDNKYAMLVDKVKELGYDVSKLNKVPQQPRVSEGAKAPM